MILRAGFGTGVGAEKVFLTGMNDMFDPVDPSLHVFIHFLARMTPGVARSPAACHDATAYVGALRLHRVQGTHHLGRMFATREVLANLCGAEHFIEIIKTVAGRS
jgi:hypothetical protein